MNYNLEDSDEFEIFHSFSFPAVFTWGSENDREHREIIRIAARNEYPNKAYTYTWWAFHIEVEEDVGKRAFDLDNVPKLILDAFSEKLIKQDNPNHLELALYPDDTLRTYTIY